MTAQIKSLEVNAGHLKLLAKSKPMTHNVTDVRNGTSDVGCCVGWCCCRRSSFNICISVVFPALSSPCNRTGVDARTYTRDCQRAILRRGFLHSCCRVPNNSRHCRTCTATGMRTPPKCHPPPSKSGGGSWGDRCGRDYQLRMNIVQERDASNPPFRTWVSPSSTRNTDDVAFIHNLM